MGAAPVLEKGLSDRQLNMIAIGGVIGAGLFVGSGVVIHETGPAAFIPYILCGVVVIMVMRMLAEMAVANPSTGSFADYARRSLGGWAGFSVGWLYWYLGDHRRVRSNRRRKDRPILDSRNSTMGDFPGATRRDDRDESVLGVVIR